MLDSIGKVTAPAVARAEVPGRLCLVTHVIDGDTLVVDDGERVRLIGVNTVEKGHPVGVVRRMAAEAAALTGKLAEGKRVRLELDPENIPIQHRDKYGRTLAYVRLPDGATLNLELIRRGYGYVYTRFPFERKREFEAAERDARAERRGLWALEP